MAVGVDVGVVVARVLRMVDDVNAPREGRKELLHFLLVVAVRDEEGGELLDLLVCLSGCQPGQLDDPRSVKLGDALAGCAAHGQEAVVTVVEGDAQSLVEGEALLLHLRVKALNLHGAAHQAQRAPGGVERAVAEILLELQAMPLGDRLQLALKEKHLPVRVDLFLASAATDVSEGFGEIGDVVDEPEAVDHRIENALQPEVERARGARILHGRPLVRGDHLSVRRGIHPDDGSPQLGEHAEFAHAPPDQLQLLAILAVERVLHGGMIEEERLELRIEKHGRGDSLVDGAEEWERGGERPVALQQLHRYVAEFVEAIAE